MAGGNEAAVETFYRRYFDWMYAQARRVTRRDEAFCLDVVQESVLRVVRSIRRVDAEAALLAWLSLVIRTTALDIMRGESRRKTRELSLVASSGQLLDDTSQHDCDIAVTDDQLAWLRSEISRLDPQLVRLIELRYQQRWTLARIGQALGMSTGAIDGRLRRALLALRKRADLTEVFDDGL